MRRSGNALECDQSHSFDRARSGYVNLIPGHRRLPPEAGDTPAMLQARRRFLQRGHYEKLSSSINRLVERWLGERPPYPDGPCAVEIGSGTGYYLGRLAESLGPERLCYFGIDIAKEAARMGARSHPEICFGVADIRQGVPLTGGSAVVALSVFSPRDVAEFTRLMHPNGLLVIALPAPDHLTELTQEVPMVDVHPGKQALVTRDFSGTFDVVHQEEIRYPMDLSPQERLDLVLMGPSARHLKENEPTHLIADRRRITASFVLLGLQPLRTSG